MLASICDGPNAPLRVETISLPNLGYTDVRVRTLASGVCHTDLSFRNGAVGAPSMFPIVFGHEAVGLVEAVGAGVSRCKPGDMVLGSILPSCGECWYCIRQESQHCETTAQVSSAHHYIRADGSRALALAGLGSFSEMMQVSETSVVPIVSDLPPEQLAMIGCGVTTGVGAALWTAKVEPGSTVAVFGCGGIGQSVLQGARLAGAERIFAVDPVALKREMASLSGATDLIDPTQGDPVAAIREATGGRGVDYSFEATGIPAVSRQAFDAVRKRGVAVIVGMPPSNSEVAVSGRSLFYEEKQLRGSLYGSAQSPVHLPMVVRFAERGQLDLSALVTKLIELDQINEAFEAMIRGDVIRSVVRFA
jgi:S-(hydroxymethyl)glutathione dehydrogenase/alcohol dehydrogenase